MSTESSASLSPPLPPPLDELDRQIQSLIVDLDRLTAGLDARAFNWSPDESSWSIGQCLDHLDRVDRDYVVAIERAIEGQLARAGQGQGRARHRYGLFERLTLSSMEPPPRLKMPAPSSVAPPSNLDPDSVVSALRVALEGRSRLLEAGSSLDLARLKIRSPVAPILKLKVDFALSFLAAHDRRHLWQAWKVRRHDGFPA